MVFNNGVSNISLCDSLFRNKEMDSSELTNKSEKADIGCDGWCEITVASLVPAYGWSVFSAQQGGSPAQPLKSIKLVDLRYGQGHFTPVNEK